MIDIAPGTGQIFLEHKPTQREIVSESCQIKPNSDCNNPSPIDLTNKMNSVWCRKIYRKTVIIIQITYDLTRFRKHFSACISLLEEKSFRNLI